MSIVDSARDMVRNVLDDRSMRRHRSLIGWRDAGRYSAYLERCRAEAPLSVDAGGLAGAVEDFRRDGATTFRTDETRRIAESMMARIRENPDLPWDADDLESGNRNYRGDLWNDFPELEELFRGPLGTFLTAFYGAPFKIHHGTLYRSRAVGGARDGSQLWHSDGGPGTCINVMFYLHPCGVASGGLEALPWPESMALYARGRRILDSRQRKLPRKERRAIQAEFYGRTIESELADRVIRPESDEAGLVVPFLNNTLHRGGFPTDGGERTAIVFHCYPSHRPTDWDLYRRKGIAKTAPYPRDPAAEF